MRKKTLCRREFCCPFGHKVKPQVCGAAPDDETGRAYSFVDGGRGYKLKREIEPNELRTTHMNESISEIQRLLQEIADHLKAGTTPDTRRAVTKLERITALASTLAFTLQAARR